MANYYFFVKMNKLSQINVKYEERNNYYFSISSVKIDSPPRKEYAITFYLLGQAKNNIEVSSYEFENIFVRTLLFDDTTGLYASQIGYLDTP